MVELCWLMDGELGEWGEEELLLTLGGCPLETSRRGISSSWMVLGITSLEWVIAYRLLAHSAGGPGLISGGCGMEAGNGLLQTGQLVPG